MIEQYFHVTFTLVFLSFHSSSSQGSAGRLIHPPAGLCIHPVLSVHTRTSKVSSPVAWPGCQVTSQHLQPTNHLRWRPRRCLGWTVARYWLWTTLRALVVGYPVIRETWTTWDSYGCFLQGHWEREQYWRWGVYPWLLGAWAVLVVGSVSMVTGGVE